jgi:hypothetical protein
MRCCNRQNLKKSYDQTIPKESVHFVLGDFLSTAFHNA